MSTLESAYQPPTPGPFSIVFIHGLNGHAKTTWMSDPRDTATFWPVWIGEDSGCDTWVLGYDAELSGWRDAAMSLPAQGTSVLDRLGAKPQLKGRPLILVGHSMGGLVIKTAIVHATTQGVERYQKLAAQIRGVVFLATPHQGSDLANVADAARMTLQTNMQVGDMTAHNDHLLTLNRQFVAQLDKLNFHVRTFVETKGMEVGRRFWGLFLGPRVTVVKAGSGDPHVPGEVPISIAANHSTICKPASRRGEQVHDSLLDFIRECTIAAPSATPEEARRAPPDQSLPIAEFLKAPVPATAVGLPGQLSGHTDSRLRSREGVVLGRDKEIAKVLAFLRSSDDSAVVCAQVTGFGGIGKTEVCKAALKAWLANSPTETVFYVDVPDEASPAELPTLIGRALGASDIAHFDQLALLLKPGLYYLDNLESVAEKADGVKLLRALQQRNGVRLLVSSRVDLAGVMPHPIRIDVLPVAAAMQLFRKLWAGEIEPSDPELSQYVSKDLGCHALSITLTARLGHSYSFEELVMRWRKIGVTFAKDGPGDSRLDSLRISLKLTRDALSSQPGALSLWTLAALFPSGIDSGLATYFQQEGGWPEEARQALTRHHVWQLRDNCFHLLPPVARFALDETINDSEDQWCEVKPLAFNFFVGLATQSNPSTEKNLRTRSLLLSSFDALHRLVFQELRQSTPDVLSIKILFERLISQFQLRPVLSAEILRASLPLYKEEQDSLRGSKVLMTLGELEIRLGNFDEARALYERLLRFFERTQNELGQATTSHSLGTLEYRLGHANEARALYASAQLIFEKEQNQIGLAYLLKSQGDLESHFGHLDETRAMYERALRLFEVEQDRIGQANTLHMLGELERQQENINEARSMYERALRLFEGEYDQVGQANTLWSLGGVESGLGHPDEARELFRRALRLYEDLQDELGQANTFRKLGELQSRQGHSDEARELFGRALQLYEGLQAGLGQANTFYSLGSLEHQLGRNDDARILFKRAQQLYESIKDEPGQADMFHAVGDLDRIAGAFHDALFSYHSALRLYGQHRLGRTYVLVEVAWCYHALGQKDECDIALKEAWIAAHALKVEKLSKYVDAKLGEISGSSDSAKAWLKDKGLSKYQLIFDEGGRH